MLSDEQILDLIETGELVIEQANDIDEQTGPTGIDLRVGVDYVQPPAMSEVFNAHDHPDQELAFQPETFYNVHTIERIELPDNLRGVIGGRLSIESQGLEVVTDGSVDPGFVGQLRIGVKNHLPEEFRLQPGEPIVELGFEFLDDHVETPYGEQDSQQFQGQEGI